ncbi:adhesion G-protein coupled receptor G2-like [Pristis pectinata]|uniref:adhesion G-protein coupled receptor G2-like n=1 Tax=Pristis pectinata TaxID=685728 RepID=UPI00223CD803|nr:adhesion G-protein coupled receptor G2-like [Pristis pectinata]
MAPFSSALHAPVTHALTLLWSFSSGLPSAVHVRRGAALLSPFHVRFCSTLRGPFPVCQTCSGSLCCRSLPPASSVLYAVRSRSASAPGPPSPLPVRWNATPPSPFHVRFSSTLRGPHPVCQMYSASPCCCSLPPATSVPSAVRSRFALPSQLLPASPNVVRGFATLHLFTLPAPLPNTRVSLLSLRPITVAHSRVGEQTSDNQDADVEVILPAELSERAEEQQNDLSRLIFSVFNDTELFEDENNSTLLNQQVFGIFVGNTSIQNLTEGVTIKINHGNTIPNGSHQCVFWFENDNGKLKASLNVSDLRQDNTLDESDVVALTYITKIGCGISAIFSAVTVLLYCVIRKRKGDHTTKIHINLCIACFLLDVTFLTNEWLSKLMIEGLCKTIAVFLHYSLLCTLTWMAIEGLHLYLMLIKVFNTYIKHYIQKLAFLGWGIPAVVVSLCIAVDKNNYGQFHIKTQDNNSSVSMCWITNYTVHYVTNCGFFGIIWLGNLTMLITVCVKLAQMRKGNNSGSKSVRKDLWTVLGLSYLLGITWALAFFSYGPMTVVQMYLFCILNSLQGFFIFLWYCAIKRPSKDQTTNDTSDK